MENLPLVVNLVMMALSGAFGAGVVWTTLKITMSHYKIDFDKSCQLNEEAHNKIIQTYTEAYNELMRSNQESHAELVRSNQEAHADIRRRQSSLRGELNGGKSVYLPRDEFIDKYTLCGEFKHSVIESLATIKNRNIQKDQNWVELKYILRLLAKERGIEVPDNFGK